MRGGRALAAIAVVVASGCGGDDGGGDGGIDVSSLTYRTCPLDRHVGGFDIVLGDGFTAVQGQVFDAVTPTRVAQTIMTTGTCSWLRAPMLVCNPACATGQTCGPSGCVAQPVAQDVGEVTVAGMKVAVAMPARAPAFFYSFAGTVPDPGFELGAGLRLDVGGLALLGWGIERLLVPSSTMMVTRGQPVTVAWTAPTQTGPAKVELVLNVNGHGLVGSHVDCVADDTGTFTIPEPLVTALLDDGLSGFPTLTVRRTTTDTGELAGGCIELDVEAAKTIDVTIPGLESCSGPEDCTPPATCRPDLTCG